MQELKDLYDIYDFWYIPWWETWWGISLLAVAVGFLGLVISLFIFYGIKKYSHKRNNEWRDINNQLGGLLQKSSLTKDEYQHLIVLLKRKLVLCFDASLVSKTDEELCAWLKSFPSGSMECQIAPLFDASVMRFAPALTNSCPLASYVQMAFDYTIDRKMSS